MINPRSTNRGLLIFAVLLSALSAWAYHHSVQRAVRFEKGQKFLSNLNPDEIAQITLRQGESTTRLERSGDGLRFLVTSENGYRAENAAVNRLIRHLLDLSLNREVGWSEGLVGELQLAAGVENSNSVEVTLLNASDQEMVQFVVGRGFEEGPGSYVMRLDEESPVIFLTEQSVRLTTEGADLLDKTILDVDREEIQTIRGEGFTLKREPTSSEGAAAPLAEAASSLPMVRGELILEDRPEGQKESPKVRELESLLSGLRFERNLLANESEVLDLDFNRHLEVELRGGAVYQLGVAVRGESHYLRIQGFHREEVEGGVTIARDAGEAEVKQTSEVLMAIDELKAFNAFHGSWIYEVNESVARRVRQTREGLLEPVS